MNSKQQKQQSHEKSCGDLLLNLLSEKYWTYVRHGNEIDEPDLIYKNERNTLGIEVTVAYRNNLLAEDFWNIRSNLGKKNKYFDKLQVGPPEAHLIDMVNSINNRLMDKCSNTSYNIKPFTKVYLCIYLFSPIFDKTDLERCFKKIQVPIESKFKNIFLLLQDNGGKFLYQKIQ